MYCFYYWEFELTKSFYHIFIHLIIVRQCVLSIISWCALFPNIRHYVLILGMIPFFHSNSESRHYVLDFRITLCYLTTNYIVDIRTVVLYIDKTFLILCILLTLIHILILYDKYRHLVLIFIVTEASKEVKKTAMQKVWVKCMF